MFIYKDLTNYIWLLPAVFMTLALHESVKAHCSARLGDPTPKKKGFLSGNPFKYIEPIGFLCTLIFGFGWGNPVPTSPLYYKDRKKGTLITYITPSLVNLMAGVAAAAVSGVLETVALDAAESMPGAVLFVVLRLLRIVHFFARTSIAVALFNVIPVYPLDGAKVLQLYLSPNWAVKMTQYEKMLQLVLILLMTLGFAGGVINFLTDAIMKIVW